MNYLSTGAGFLPSTVTPISGVINPISYTGDADAILIVGGGKEFFHVPWLNGRIASLGFSLGISTRISRYFTLFQAKH